jgi:hypothetical protein
VSVKRGTLVGSGGGRKVGYTLKAAEKLNTVLVSWSTIATGSLAGAGCLSSIDAGAIGRASRTYRLSVP